MRAFLAAGVLVSALIAAATAQNTSTANVILISVDGLHASDLDWIANTGLPNGTLAKMAASGVTYSNASIESNTDSFPGVVALVTGANPVTTGVYYDVSYDRELWAPGTNCTDGKPDGQPGTVVTYDESLDLDNNNIYGGGDPSPAAIDPKNLPLDASCKPVYPHQFLRANTIFEVAKAGGLVTAWTDKHPAYDLLNGPSGKGIDQLYTPEINSGDLGLDFTHDPSTTPVYDNLHTAAIVNWINGNYWNGTTWGATPNLLGGNYQSVSVAQKAPGAGYEADGVTPSPLLLDAFKFIDYSLSIILDALDQAGIANSTTVIITAKHGQSPKKPSQVNLLQDTLIPDLLAANNITVAASSQDDVSLLWLADSSQAGAAAALLKANATALGIDSVFTGDSSQGVALPWQGNPANDSRAPDIVTKVIPGTIYVGDPSKHSKIAEHGGINEDDKRVGLLVYKQGLSKSEVADAVFTTQVAPTVLQLLGLSPADLTGVKAEGTKALPGLTYP